MRKMKMRNVLDRNRSGFSLLELLIAMIILSVLTVMVVFAFTKRADEARITNAMNAIRELAEGEEQICVHTGFFTQLYYLDDPATTDTVNRPNNLQGVFINPKTNPAGQMVDDEDYIWQRIRPLPTNPNRHRGPYLEFKQQVTFDDNFNGTPVDPWGNVYMFFTPYGFVDPQLGVVTPGGVSTPSGTLTYDRFTVVSCGPDGILNTSDDIKQQF